MRWTAESPRHEGPGNVSLARDSAVDTPRGMAHNMRDAGAVLRALFVGVSNAQSFVWPPEFDIVRVEFSAPRRKKFFPDGHLAR